MVAIIDDKSLIETFNDGTKKANNTTITIKFT